MKVHLFLINNFIMGELYRIETEKIVSGNYLHKGSESLTSWSGNLPLLTSSYEMFADCSNLTTFNGDLSNLTKDAGVSGRIEVHAYEYESGENIYEEYNMSQGMFEGCHNLNSIETNLNSLTHGGCMFSNCTSLTQWNIPLPALTHGEGMFSESGLVSFTQPLNSLQVGGMAGCRQYESIDFDGDKYSYWYQYNYYYVNGMFKNTPLTQWNIDLPALTDGTAMFHECDSLESFSGSLNNLERGGDWNYEYDYAYPEAGMFYSTKITTWNIPLPKLQDATGMFKGSNLHTFNVSELPLLKYGDYMFSNTGFTELPSINMPILETADGMFQNCLYLTNISVPNIYPATRCAGMFSFNPYFCIKNNSDIFYNYITPDVLRGLDDYYRQFIDFQSTDFLPPQSIRMFAYYDWDDVWEFYQSEWPLVTPRLYVSPSGINSLIENCKNNTNYYQSLITEMMFDNRIIYDGDNPDLEEDTVDAITQLCGIHPFEGGENVTQYTTYVGALFASTIGLDKFFSLGWRYMDDGEFDDSRINGDVIYSVNYDLYFGVAYDFGFEVIPLYMPDENEENCYKAIVLVLVPLDEMEDYEWPE